MVHLLKNGLGKDDSMVEFFILIGFSILCGIGAYIGFKERKRVSDEHNAAVATANMQKEDALTKNKPLMRANYNRIKSNLSVPMNCAKIDVETTVFGIQYKAQAPVGKLMLLRNDFYIWFENGILNILPTEEHLVDEHITYATLPKDLAAVLNPNDIRAFSIPVTKIKHYKIVGQERSETKVHSTNDGINVKGAIIGGIIAGDAGAVIGSQHNKGQIVSNTEHFDERFVELYYEDNGVTQKLKLSITAYPVLEKCMPEKEYDFVLSNVPSNDTSTDKFEEIKKYKALMDDGIITQEEFETKKKELLGV